MTDALTPVGLTLATGATLAKWGVRRPRGAVGRGGDSVGGRRQSGRGVAAPRHRGDRGAVDPTFRLLADAGRLEPRVA